MKSFKVAVHEVASAASEGPNFSGDCQRRLPAMLNALGSRHWFSGAGFCLGLMA